MAIEHKLIGGIGIDLSQLARDSDTMDRIFGKTRTIRMTTDDAEKRLRALLTLADQVDSSVNKIISRSQTGGILRESFYDGGVKRSRSIDLFSGETFNEKRDLAPAIEKNNAAYVRMFGLLSQIRSIRMEHAGKEAEMGAESSKRLEQLNQEFAVLKAQTQLRGEEYTNEEKKTRLLEMQRKIEADVAMKSEKVEKAETVRQVNALYTEQARLIKEISTLERQGMSAGESEREIIAEISSQKQQQLAAVQSQIEASDMSVRNTQREADMVALAGQERDKNQQYQARLNDQQDAHNKKLQESNNLLNTMSKTLIAMATVYAVRTLRDTWRSTLEYVSQYYDAMNEIRIVTGYTQQQADALGDRYMTIAQNMSVSSLEVAKMGATLFRQGLGSDEAVEGRMEAVIKYAKIAGEDVQRSADLITVATNTFRREGESAADAAMRVVDVWTYMGDAVETEAGEIGRAMQKVVANAKVVGLSLEKTSALIATMSSVTREAPEVIGTALNRIISRYEKITSGGFAKTLIDEDGVAIDINDVAKALAVVDIKLYETGKGFTSFGDVIDAVGSKWGTLRDEEQRYIATQMAGVHGINKFYALMQDYEGSMELYQGSLNARGSADQKYAIHLESVAAAQDDMKNSLEALYGTLMGGQQLIGFYKDVAGFVDSLKLGIDALGGVNHSAIILIGTLGSLFLIINRIYQSWKSFQALNAGAGLLGFLGGGHIKMILGGLALLSTAVISIVGEFKKGTVNVDEFRSRLKEIGAEASTLTRGKDDLKETIQLLNDLRREPDSSEKDQKYIQYMDDLIAKMPEMGDALKRHNGDWVGIGETIDILTRKLGIYEEKLAGLSLEQAALEIETAKADFKTAGTSEAHYRDMANINFDYVKEFVDPSNDGYTRLMEMIDLLEDYNRDVWDYGHDSIEESRKEAIAEAKKYVEARYETFRLVAGVLGKDYGDDNALLMMNPWKWMPDMQDFFDQYSSQEGVSRSKHQASINDMHEASRRTARAISEMMLRGDNAAILKDVDPTIFQEQMDALRTQVHALLYRNLIGEISDDDYSLEITKLRIGTENTIIELNSKLVEQVQSGIESALSEAAASSGTNYEAMLPQISSMLVGLEIKDKELETHLGGWLSGLSQGDLDLVKHFDILKQILAFYAEIDASKLSMLDGTERGAVENLTEMIGLFRDGKVTAEEFFDAGFGRMSETTTWEDMLSWINAIKDAVYDTTIVLTEQELLEQRMAQAREKYREEYRGDWDGMREEKYGEGGSATSDAASMLAIVEDMLSGGVAENLDRFVMKLTELDEAALTVLGEKFPSLGAIIDAVLNGATISAEDLTYAVKNLKEELDNVNADELEKSMQDLEDSGKVMKGLGKTLKDMAKGGSTALKSQMSLAKEARNYVKAQAAANAIIEEGNVLTEENAELYELLGSHVGMSADELVANMSPALQLLAFEGDALIGTLEHLVNSVDWAGAVDFNTSGWMAALMSMDGQTNDSIALIQALFAAVRDAGNMSLTASQAADGSVSFKSYVPSTPKTTKPRGGGGGGGGKKDKEQEVNTSQVSDALKSFLDLLKQSSEMGDFRRELVQLSKSYHDQRGEITAMITLTRQEMDILRDITKEDEAAEKQILSKIQAKQQEMKAYSQSSHEYAQAATDLEELQKQHKEYSQKLIKNKTDLESLGKEMKEYRKQIREMEIELRDLLLQAFQDRDDLQRGMLDSRVEIEDTIFSVIQARYQKEWDLIRKDADLKRKAYNEEIRLIREKLAERKKEAEDTDKYKQLADLEKQLSMVAVDPIRTKDQQELTKKIAALREELSWREADKEAELQEKSIQQQIDSLDKYLEYTDQYYEDMFKNPQVLIEEMNSVIRSSSNEMRRWLIGNYKGFNNLTASEQDAALEKMYQMAYATDAQLIEWMSANVVSFSDMNKATQQNLMDSLRSMAGEADREIIEWLKANNEEFSSASKDKQQQMISTWTDTLMGMHGVTALYWNEIENIIMQGDDAIIQFLKDNLAEYKEAGDLQSSAYVDEWLERLAQLRAAYVDTQRVLTDSSAWTPAAPAASSPSTGNTGGSPGGGSKKTYYGYYYNPQSGAKYSVTSTISQADADAKAKIKQDELTAAYIRSQLSQPTRTSTSPNKPGSGGGGGAGKPTILPYSDGGLVDYTGLAAVHGSKLNPEAFLSARDTKTIRSLLDGLNMIAVPSMPKYSFQSRGKEGSLSVDNLVIHVEKLDDDQDFEILTEKVIQSLGHRIGVPLGTPVTWGR